MRNNKLHSRTVNHQTRFASHARSPGARSPRAFSQLNFDAFLSFLLALIIGLPAVGSQGAVPEGCLAREGATSIIDRGSRSRYEAKLCVTPDEVARYVFLTNRWDYGDRSAAVYRARHKKGSLPGDFWITATVAEDSTRGDRRNVGVRRYDAPLPESVADLLHVLWVTILEQSRIEENAIPCAPTGIFTATTKKGIRLRAVTVDLPSQDSLCIALMDVGGSLVDYAKLPRSKRPQAAAEIEKQARHLLQRVAPRENKRLGGSIDRGSIGVSHQILTARVIAKVGAHA